MRGILGADIFINLLLVFIITTGLLLMNTNKVLEDIKSNPSELDLPGIQLPKGSSDGVPAGNKRKQVILSAKIEGNKTIYFIDEKPVEFNTILSKMKSQQVDSVKIRFDGNIAYGRYVEILDICKQAGVKEIINVYTAKT
jgi:biopolymer transport protein ExbD